VAEAAVVRARRQEGWVQRVRQAATDQRV